MQCESNHYQKRAFILSLHKLEVDRMWLLEKALEECKVTIASLQAEMETVKSSVQGSLFVLQDMIRISRSNYCAASE
jgi:hypothetical protein